MFKCLSIPGVFRGFFSFMPIVFENSVFYEGGRTGKQKPARYENSFSFEKFPGKILFLFFLVFLFSERILAGEIMDVWKNNRAVDQLKQKKFLEAREGFSYLLGENSFHPVFQFNLGSSFIGLGDFERAVKMYRETLKLNPLPPNVEFTVLYNLGVLHSQLINKNSENLDQALHYYQKALEFNPDSKEIKVNIELLLQRNRKAGNSSNKNQKNKNQESEGEKNKKFTNNPEKGEGKKYKNKKLSKKDVDRILNELKKQEQSIRAKHERKNRKEAVRDKNW